MQGPGLGTTTPAGGGSVTISGALVGAGSNGLTIQGTADGPNSISETVLAGTVSYSGTPLIYNWSSTASSTLAAPTSQYFINGPGGIDSGVTLYTAANTTNSILTSQNNGANITLLDVPSTPATPYGYGAMGFVRFDGVNSLMPGAVGPGYFAALHQSSDPTAAADNGLFGYLLTGTTGDGTTYTAPEGKGFVIGSLGAGTQVGGTFGVAGGDGSLTPYVATFNGAPKAAPGQTLAGFFGGDINIHANAATDSQSLDLLARASNDTLILGGSSTVVITPTYGDSGWSTTAITLMAERTGGTTLNKIGAGTVQVSNVAFTNVDGSDARSTFTWNVNAGTLNYAQNDAAGAKFAGFNVNSGATLTGSGTLNGDVVVHGGGILAPGNGVGTLTIGTAATPGSLTIGDAANPSVLELELNNVATSGNDLIAVNGNLDLANTTLDLDAYNGDLANTTYKLFTYTGTLTGDTSDWTIGSSNAGSLHQYAFNTSNPGEIDLVVSSPTSSVWNFNGNGNYTDATKWSPQTVPSGAGQTATFGNGDTAAVNAPAVAVTIDSAITLGSIVFDNTNGTSYTLATDGNAAHGITLDSGIGSGSSIVVAAGNHAISADVTLADAGGQTFALSSGTSLSITGAIGETGAGKSIVLSGGGALTLGHSDTYTGGTTITAGTLTTTADGALGGGSLIVNAANNATSAANLGSNETISSLTGTVGASNASAAVSVAAGKTLTIDQASGSSSFAGSLALGSGATLVKSSAGIQELTGNTSLGGTSAVQVAGGTLKLNLAAGSSPTVGVGATATVAAGATLELAGPVSALTDATTNVHRVDITDNSGTILADSGATQQVGGIDGTGNVQVNTGASLTANHITAGGAGDRRRRRYHRNPVDRSFRYQRQSGRRERLCAGWVVGGIEFFRRIQRGKRGSLACRGFPGSRGREFVGRDVRNRGIRRCDGGRSRALLLVAAGHRRLDRVGAVRQSAESKGIDGRKLKRAKGARGEAIPQQRFAESPHLKSTGRRVVSRRLSSPLASRSETGARGRADRPRAHLTPATINVFER